VLSPGIRLGPYEIGAPIGRGGMGEVYRAHDARLDRVVALKVLPTALSTDRLALELDPLDVLLNVHLGWAYLQARRYDESIAQSLKAIAMDPTLEVAHTTLARAYLGKGMYTEALAEFQKVVTLAGGVATGPDTYLGYTDALFASIIGRLGLPVTVTQRP
jgi:serine/threonine protein kinase